MPRLMIRRLLTPVLALGMVAPVIQAANNDAADTQTILPNLEFLEFLGQWETDEGEWLPPEQLIDGEFVQLLDAAMINIPSQETDSDSNDDGDQTDE